MREHGIQFDIDAARQSASDFSASTGIHCRVLNPDGEELAAGGENPVCPALSGAVGNRFRCAGLHARASGEASRFGGRYIYTCPMGLAFFASPIMTGGAFTGGLVAGPVLLTDPEDLLSGAAVTPDMLSPDAAGKAFFAVEKAPSRDPAQLESLSRQLFATAVYVSDSSQELLAARDEGAQSSAIDDYISYLKNSEGARVVYPLEKEQELYRAIVRGDRETADTLINQLLGHIYFYAVDNEEIYTRITELLVVLLRAHAAGNADVEHTLSLSRAFLKELRNLRTQEELTRWLAAKLRRLTDQIFPVSDLKHSAAMQKVVDYMKRKYALRLTLEEVAEYAGYSPAYFSRIFREDTGMTFKEYLNELRIEKGKSLLLTTGLSITEISTMTGFNDQSYFCKIFKSVTGVTPDKFRKRSRRIDYEKEYGLKQ